MTDPSPLGDAAAGVRCTIIPGTGDYHLALAGCDDCTVRHLSRKTLDQVEDMYHRGYVDQDTYEAYRHVWATAAPRFSSLADGWKEPPNTERARTLAQWFRDLLPKGARQ